MLHVMDVLLAHGLLSSGCRLCGRAPGRHRLRLSAQGAAQCRVFCSVETCALVLSALCDMFVSIYFVNRQSGSQEVSWLCTCRAQTAPEVEAPPAKQASGSGKGNAKQPGRGQKAATSSKEEDIRALRLDKAGCITHIRIQPRMDRCLTCS